MSVHKKMMIPLRDCEISGLGLDALSPENPQNLNNPRNSVPGSIHQLFS